MTERDLSRVAATRRGVHDRLMALEPGRPPTYSPHRRLEDAFLTLIGGTA